MFLEALEILNSAGQDEDTFVTDFGIYKITYILTVYLPIALSTFLLSQEYLGDKIACFAPDSFSDNHAEALNEYCWNNGFWVSDGVLLVKNLYTQPHRFYPLYLPVQAVLFTSPIVLWNILTKSHLLAVLRGTEEFLQDLLDVVQKGQDELDETSSRAKELMRQFHQTCVQAAQKSSLAKTGIMRVTWEMFLLIFTICMQFFIYNHKVKEYQCTVPEIDREGNQILCTVPILDLLDAIWSFNLSALILALALNFYMVFRLYQMHFSEFQPLFYNNLPYGDSDDFNEKVIWESRWTKDSYRLLTRIFAENNSIMTKAYVLMAMKPQETDEISERDKEQQLRLRRLSKTIQKKGDEEDTSSGEEEEDEMIRKQQRAQLIKSHSKVVSFDESANGRPAMDHGTSFASTNDDSMMNGTAALDRGYSHISFATTNGGSEMNFDPEQTHDSSGRGSLSRFPSQESYSAFQPLASSSRRNTFRQNSTGHNAHVERNGYQNDTGDTQKSTLEFGKVVDQSSRGIRQRLQVVSGNSTDEVKPKLSDFSVVTLLVIVFPLIILSVI